MLTTIGFITIVTAAITSTFVEAARRRPRERANKPKPAVTAMAVRSTRSKEPSGYSSSRRDHAEPCRPAFFGPSSNGGASASDGVQHGGWHLDERRDLRAHCGRDDRDNLERPRVVGESELVAGLDGHRDERDPRSSPVLS
jgi:hypothetical protein